MFNNLLQTNRRERRRLGGCVGGMVALPLMVLISGVVLEMTIAASLVVFYLLQGSAGGRNADEALLITRSGVNDVAIQLVRDMDFDEDYILHLDDQQIVKVNVCNQGSKTSPCGEIGGCDYTNPADAGKVNATIMGTVRGSSRCVRAVYAVDRNTGEVKFESTEEIPL